jgi:hypothetical protein
LFYSGKAFHKHIMPPMTLGSGITSIPQKFFTIAHSAKLDVSIDPRTLSAYSKSCLGFCCDFGESGVPRVPPISIKAMMQHGIDESKGLLIMKPPNLVNDDTSLAAPAPQDEDFKFDLSNTLLIPGLKHISDNLEKDATRDLPHMKPYLEELRPLVQMLDDAWTRDRLAYTCFEHTLFKNLMKNWEGGTLTEWCWSSLVKVLKAVKRRAGALREHWDIEKYVTKGESKPECDADGNHVAGNSKKNHYQD